MNIRLLSNLFLIPAFITISSCSVFRHKEFDRGGLTSQLAVETPKYDDNSIKKEFQKRPNLPKSFRLAVYFKKPTSDTWRWTEEDKNSFLEFGKSLVDQKIASDVFSIIPSMVENENLKSLRLVAAKHQADALLIVSGAGDVDRYLNKLGTSYILLAPVLFVPGSQAETLFVTNAVVWDVKNEFLYLAAETEAVLTDSYIAAFPKTDKELFSETKTLSLNKLKEELKKSVLNKKL